MDRRPVPRNRALRPASPCREDLFPARPVRDTKPARFVSGLWLRHGRVFGTPVLPLGQHPPRPADTISRRTGRLAPARPLPWQPFRPKLPRMRSVRAGHSPGTFRSGQLWILSGQCSRERPMMDVLRAAQHITAAEELCQPAPGGTQMIHLHCNVNAIPRPGTASRQYIASLPGSLCNRSIYSQNLAAVDFLHLVDHDRYLVSVFHFFYQRAQVAAVPPLIQSSRFRIRGLCALFEQRVGCSCLLLRAAKWTKASCRSETTGRRAGRHQYPAPFRAATPSATGSPGPQSGMR